MKKQYWIKERYNPQLRTHWLACGIMSKAAAKRASKYEENIMHAFDTEESYDARLWELRNSGEHVQ